MIRPRLTAACVALFLLGSTGCVTFERESMVYAFPKGSNEIRALFVYEGIRVNNAEPKSLDDAKKQLAALAADNRLFYLGGWSMPVEMQKLYPDETESDKNRAFRQLIRDNVKTHAEEFYLNKDGRLCLVQSVTITDPQRLCNGINAMISEEVKAATAEVLHGAKHRTDWMDEETVRLLHKASSAKHFDWLKLEPGRFSYTAPMSPTGASNLKRELFQVKRLDEFLKATQDGMSKEQIAVLRESLQGLEVMATFLSEVPFSVDERQDHTTFAVGVGGGQPIRVPGVFDESVRKKGGQDEALIAFARTLKVPFKEGLTSDGVISDFLKAMEK